MNGSIRGRPVNRRRLLIIIILAALLPLCALAAVFIGSVSLDVAGIVEIRLTRILVAALVGAALSVSGAILQAILRNPLADPYVLGISAGGGLGAVIAIVSGLTFVGLWSVPFASFIGSILTIFLVYSLGRTGGKVSTYTLLLAGVVVGAVFSSLLMFIVSTAQRIGLQSAIWWLLGNLDVERWQMIWILLGAVLAGIGLALIYSRDLNIMALGEEPASHVGLHVERVKIFFFVLSSLITGVTVATCGLIGFVGLIVPHIMRLIIGPDHRYLVPASALGGACFLILADIPARTLIAPQSIPIGVVTAFLGGPFFLYLLRRRKKAYWG